MSTASRPTRDSVVTPALQQAIFDTKLKLDVQFRPELQRLLTTARQSNDRGATAFVAFALAYSYDHYEPCDYEQAVQLLVEALAYFPDWPEALFNLGVTRIHARKFDEAVRELEAADRAYFGSLIPNVLNRDESDLIRGTLLMFLAEARCGRAKSGDAELARSDLNRAEGYLNRCLEKADTIANQARFWLMQIPLRLKSTIAEGEPEGSKERIRSPFAFLFGVLAVPLVLWWLVCVTSPVSATSTDSIPAGQNSPKKDGVQVQATAKDVTSPATQQAVSPSDSRESPDKAKT